MQTANLTRVPSADHAAIIETLHREGVVVVDSLLDERTISAINSEVQPRLDRTETGGTKINDSVDEFYGSSLKRVSSLASHSPTFATEVLTFHFGGANTTADQWRRVVHLSYTLGWLRTEENNYLGTPPSVARQLPPEVQGLIGYSIHDGLEAGGGFLGMVDMHNPLDLLANGSLGA
jgi:hypothetical protein